MQIYQKERLENAMLFFVLEHYKKAKKYPSQTVLYKYLAFFEFQYMEKTGTMPLELTYRAMKNGPVPIEIYDKRSQPNAFSTVDFELFTTKTENDGYTVKPKGKFNPDYFAIAELEEMRKLIDIFAQQWVDAKVMSDASHESLLAWKRTYAKQPNAIIDPINVFDRDLSDASPDTLSSAEEKFLIHRKIAELAK